MRRGRGNTIPGHSRRMREEEEEIIFLVHTHRTLNANLLYVITICILESLFACLFVSLKPVNRIKNVCWCLFLLTWMTPKYICWHKTTAPPHSAWPYYGVTLASAFFTLALLSHLSDLEPKKENVTKILFNLLLTIFSSIYNVFLNLQYVLQLTIGSSIDNWFLNLHIIAISYIINVCSFMSPCGSKLATK